MRLQPAGPDDLARVEALVNRAYRGPAARGGWTHEADVLDGLRIQPGDLARTLGEAIATTILLGLDDEGALIGCVMAALEEKGVAEIGMLSVEPALQAKGVGRALLEGAEHAGARMGALTARLHVIAQRTELVAWYQRRGYVDTGARTPFPHDANAGRPLRRDLEFLILEKPLA
jgi:ribosomal protein S18 acetylase RimI-like enzyme